MFTDTTTGWGDCKNISPHFATAEVAHSDVAKSKGIKNWGCLAMMDDCHATALKMEQARAILGDVPIVVTSWYRCPELNTLIGGKPNSLHMKCRAVDFTAPQFGTVPQVFNALRHADWCFDKLINEGDRWLHVQFQRRDACNRRHSFNLNPATGKVWDLIEHNADPLLSRRFGEKAAA